MSDQTEDSLQQKVENLRRATKDRETDDSIPQKIEKLSIVGSILKKIPQFNMKHAAERNSGRKYSAMSVDLENIAFAALSINRNKNVYREMIEKLKKDFQSKLQQQSSMNREGLENFKLLRTLGTGSFGRVYLAYNEKSQTYYAMKCLDKSKIIKQRQIEHAFNEKIILSNVRYPFIISTEYCFMDHSYLYYVMEFMRGGDLFTHLRRSGKFSESTSRFYASQVLLAIEFLHFCDILYRDLKPENILLDETGYLKIADLGFCKIVKGRTFTLCGTPEYIAPEIMLAKGYGKPADWWSFGILLFEMNSGHPPFVHSDPMKIFKKIIKCRYKCPKTFSTELKDLIENLIKVDLTKRYGCLRNSTDDLRFHTWFRPIDFFAIYNRQISPPYKPNLKSPDDTSYFDRFREESLNIAEQDTYAEEFKDF